MQNKSSNKKNRSQFYLLTLIIGLVTFFFGSVFYSYSPFLIVKLYDNDIFAKVAGTTGQIIDSSNYSSNNEYYEYNGEITINAIPKEGYTFDGWYRNGVCINTNALYSFNIKDDEDLVASFVSTEEYKVANKVNVSCNKYKDKYKVLNITGNGYYRAGEVVKLSANNSYPGFVQFDSWYDLDKGMILSYSENYSFVMTENERNIVANYTFLGTNIFDCSSDVQSRFAFDQATLDSLETEVYCIDDDILFRVLALTKEDMEVKQWISSGSKVTNEPYYEFNSFKQNILDLEIEEKKCFLQYTSEKGIPDEYYISYLSILQFVGYVPMLLFCLIFFFDILKEDGREFLKKKKHNLLLILIGVGACYFCNIIMVQIYSFFGDTGSSENQDAIVGALQYSFNLPMIVSTVLIAPLVEEILYRKIFFGFCEETCKFKPIIAIVISILVFALIHVASAGDYIYIFQYIPLAASIVICYYYANRNIWVSIGIHFVNNLFAILSIYMLGLLQ